MLYDAYETGKAEYGSNDFDLSLEVRARYSPVSHAFQPTAVVLMSNSDPIDLNTPVLGDTGLKRVPFFNGRVLTAEDLNTEQDANDAERRRLGRAHGAGVLEGLFVRKSTEKTVVVEPGLGLAPSGQMVHLPKGVEVSVVSNIERDQTAGTTGNFEDCLTLEATVTSGTGAYVLYAEPASGMKGRTPRTRVGGDGTAGACGAKHRVEGARLRLVCLDADDPGLVPDGVRDEVNSNRQAIDKALDNNETPAHDSVARLRNLLAHACLRTPSAFQETTSLYDGLRRQSRGEEEAPVAPLDVLRARAREEAEGAPLDDAVPLGLLYWARDRILFVDVWSVRRRVHRRHPQRPMPATSRRHAEMEAAIYQFQDQMANLIERLSNPARKKLNARSYFGYLPPIGLLPVDSQVGPGVVPNSFFQGLTIREPVFIEGATVRTVLNEALGVRPIDLPPPLDREEQEPPAPREREFLWTYQVRDNREPEEETAPKQPYLLFTSGTVSYAGNPQFDRARWNYSNYGPGVNRFA